MSKKKAVPGDQILIEMSEAHGWTIEANYAQQGVKIYATDTASVVKAISILVNEADGLEEMAR